jgi:hypothetical protein
MIQLDGKTVDLTKPETWGNSIQIKPNGFIEQTKDGVTTLVQPTPQPNKNSKQNLMPTKHHTHKP